MSLQNHFWRKEKYNMNTKTKTSFAWCLIFRTSFNFSDSSPRIASSSKNLPCVHNTIVFVECWQILRFLNVHNKNHPKCDNDRCNFVSHAIILSFCSILSHEVVHTWLLGPKHGSFINVQAIFHCLLLSRPSHFKTDSKYFQPDICARSIPRSFAASPVEVFYRPYTPPPITLSLPL